MGNEQSSSHCAREANTRGSTARDPDESGDLAANGNGTSRFAQQQTDATSTAQRDPQTPTKRHSRGQQQVEIGAVERDSGYSWRIQEPMFVKNTQRISPASPLAEGPGLPPVKNFGPKADHPTKPRRRPSESEGELVTFCICKAKARWIDAENVGIQCCNRKCGKWYYRKCVGYKEPRETVIAGDYGWWCPECDFEDAESSASDVESDEHAKEAAKGKGKTKTTKRKKKKKKAGNPMR